jgi:hypothetical protein
MFNIGTKNKILNKIAMYNLTFVIGRVNGPIILFTRTDVAAIIGLTVTLSPFTMTSLVVMTS